MGANTAIFTLIDQLLLRLLPVKNPEQLVQLWGRGDHYGSNNGQNKLSYPMYADFRDHNPIFSGSIAARAHPDTRNLARRSNCNAGGGKHPVDCVDRRLCTGRARHACRPHAGLAVG